MEMGGNLPTIGSTHHPEGDGDNCMLLGDAGSTRTIGVREPDTLSKLMYTTQHSALGDCLEPHKCCPVGQLG